MSEFKIEGRHFLMDGKPFQIISGTIHYFRVVPEYWADRLKKLRAMGCNTVETYVAWNLHEPQPGEYNFSGILDIVRFIKAAQEIGLYVIVRPSPFICAEWEFGGLPAWLLSGEAISVRTKDGPFLKIVERYYSVLLPLLTPLQIEQGGPVILMQVENEYGAYGNDTEYLQKSSELMRRYGVTVPLITSDNFEQDLTRGICPGALPTANFGSGAKEKFSVLSKINRGGPLMCAEFWIGWYDAWGDEKHHTTDAEVAAAELDAVLELGSVNIYVFHGGTNFGFMNGSNDYEWLTPDVTSYDYDAPLAEDGTITAKYLAFQKVISKYTAIPKLDIPAIPRKRYGHLFADGSAQLFQNLDLLSTPVALDTPCSMEKLHQYYGYTLYSCTLQEAISTLEFTSAHDRIQIFSDGVPVRTLFDREIPGVHSVELAAGSTLELLVENLGRVNYGVKIDTQRKGIDGPVLANGTQLNGWTCHTLPLTDLEPLAFDNSKAPTADPAFYHFSLTVDDLADTFLELPGWKKGCIFVNGFNLGRFWDIGPQKRFYIPAPLLKKGHNDFIVLETDGTRGECITLVD